MAAQDYAEMVADHLKFLAETNRRIANSNSIQNMDAKTKRAMIELNEKVLKSDLALLQPLCNTQGMRRFLERIVEIMIKLHGLYTEKLQDEAVKAREKWGVGEIQGRCPHSNYSFPAFNHMTGHFNAFLNAVQARCDEEGIEIRECTGAKPKALERTFYKAFYEYGGGKAGFRQVKDLFRCSFVFDTFDALYGCYCVIKDIGPRILRAKDRFSYPAADAPFGYRDVLINIVCPKTEIVCEIQLHLHVFHFHKHDSHTMYKTARIFDGKGKRYDNALMDYTMEKLEAYYKNHYNQ
eukprot:108771_1